MSADSAQERTEQATPKRLKESREKGQVPRSKELNTMALLMASSGALLFLGGNMMSDLKAIFQHGLAIKDVHDMTAATMMEYFSSTLLQSLWLMAPFLLVTMIAVIMTPLGLGGWSFSMQAISFKFDKLDPIKGIGRIFSAKGLMELVKVLAKFSLVAVVSSAILWSLVGQLTGLSQEPALDALAHLASLCGWSFFAYSSALILIAAVDVPFQLFQHNKQLKMTLQEVKDEAKETDGRPEVKGRIRALQQELSQRRMMEAVPDADVVITNPTHYAVALKYDQNSNGAPVVVAKGADFVAARIRSVAKENEVALVEAPPLARALYASTEINQEIPAGLYVAVANILTYVYQLNAAYQSGYVKPSQPTDLPIPDELKDAMKNHSGETPASHDEP